MNRITDRLSSPNFWFLIFALLAIAGLALAALGSDAEDRLLMKIGLWLVAPLLGGIVLLVVVVPLLSLLNRKKRKRRR